MSGSGQAGGVQQGVSALQTTIGYTPPANLNDVNIIGAVGEFDSLTAGASSVNYATLSGAASAAAPQIAALGTDTNVDIDVLPKGTGLTRTKRFLLAPQSQFAAYAGTMSTNTQFISRSPAASVPSAMNSYHLFYSQPSGGTITSGAGYYNQFTVAGDGAVAAVPNGGIGGTYTLVGSVTTTATATGNRVGMAGMATIGATTADIGSHYYVGVYGVGISSFPAPAGAETKQNLFGANFASRAATDATGLFGQTGVEVNVRTETGASSQYKTGVSIIHDPTDAVRGSVADTAFLIGDTATGTSQPGWKTGISFGSAIGWWPFASDSTVIAAVGGSIKDSRVRAMVADKGVDFERVNFGTAAIKAPALTVQNGNLTLGPNTVGWSSDGMTLGTAGSVGAFSAIAAAGTGYQVGEQFSLGLGGDLWRVDTVNGTGGITAASIIVAPTVTGATPANPVAVVAHNTSSAGSAELNLTWTAARKVTLSGNIVVTPASAATPTSNGQLTFEATSNTSLTLKLRGTDGVVRSAVLALA